MRPFVDPPAPARGITRSMNEAEWQKQVLDTARMFGWRCVHWRPLLTKHGWRTPIQGDGEGWPDLTLVRDTILFVELKTDTGDLSVDQRLWLLALEAAGCETAVWRPRDAEAVMQRLARRRPPAPV